jgi:hypothetical protein
MVLGSHFYIEQNGESIMKLWKPIFLALSAFIFIMPFIPSIANAKTTESKSAVTKSINDIRKIDFRNYIYTSSFCYKEYRKDGLPEKIQVINGANNNNPKIGDVCFTVDNPIYSDLTGDGHEKAVIAARCNIYGANFMQNEIFVYTMKDGQATLLSRISENDVFREYKKFYPDEHCWTNLEIKVDRGILIINFATEGYHACPKYAVSMHYLLKGDVFTLVGKPEKSKRPEC